MRQDVPIRRLLLQRAAQTKTPVSAIFELTPRCNLNCRMCYVRMSGQELSARGRERTQEEWLSLAEQAAEAGTVLLLLTGGEPLLRPDFEALYRAFIRLGFSVSLNTNGTLLDERLCALFAELPPAAVNLTLYGADEAAYARLCGDGSGFARAASAVDRLCAAGVSVLLNTTLTPWNKDALPAIAAFAAQRALPLRTVTYLFPPLRRGGCGTERLSPEDAGRLSAQSRLLTEEPAQLARSAAAVRAKLPEPAPPQDCLSGSLEGLHCAAGRCQYWVAWNGEMYPCGMMPEPVVYPFRDGLLPAWEQLTAACEGLRSAAQCGACALRSFCPACAAAAKAETGATDGVPDYICRLTAAYCRTLAAFS